MNKRRMAALQAGLLLVTVLANAASKNYTMRITVLNSESRSVILDDSGVPKNCDGLNFDAYCHSSNAAQVTNTLLVQEEGGTPFRVACAVDSRWSRCTLLPQGESFDARQERHGITVYYQDDSGKPRRQLYTLVAADAKANLAAGYPRSTGAEGGVALDAKANLAPAGYPRSGGEGGVAPDAKANLAPTGYPRSTGGEGGVALDAKANLAAAAVPVAAPPALAPVQPAVQAPAAAAVPGNPWQTVKCSFTSTPAGAEVTVDGRFAGSTPSVVVLAAGTHAVTISMPGFAPWKRDLAVLSGSQLTVNAVMRKAP